MRGQQLTTQRLRFIMTGEVITIIHAEHLSSKQLTVHKAG